MVEQDGSLPPPLDSQSELILHQNGAVNQVHIHCEGMFRLRFRPEVEDGLLLSETQFLSACLEAALGLTSLKLESDLDIDPPTET